MGEAPSPPHYFFQGQLKYSVFQKKRKPNIPEQYLIKYTQLYIYNYDALLQRQLILFFFYVHDILFVMIEPHFVLMWIFKNCFTTE